MNQLKRYTIWGILFVSAAGTLAHFVYEWSGKNPVLALFFPVNESTWEHLKLLFFPMLAYSFFMSRRLRQNYPCIRSAVFAGLLSGCALIPVLFYTYSGILGASLVWVDIAIFYISVIAAFLLAYRWATSMHSCSKVFPVKKAGLNVLILLLTICFFLFTYYPPEIGLFFS